MKHMMPSCLEEADFPSSGKAFYVPSLSGNLLAWGPTVPSDTDEGYAKGCLFIHSDAASDATRLYINVGSGSSANFDAIDAVGIETELAATTSGNGASKVGVYDSAGNFTGTNVEAVLAEIITTLASAANGNGASTVGVEDSAGNFTATDVEAALAEIMSLLASTSNAEGAALVGVEDSAGNFTATDVEAALAEIMSLLASTSNAEGAALVGVEDSAGNFTATDVEAALAEIASDYSPNVRNVIDAGGSTALTAAQSGSLVVLTGEDVVTLPAAAAGLWYDFLVTDITTQTPRIDPDGTEQIYVNVSSTWAAQAAGKYVAPTAAGDMFRLYSDGTSWYGPVGTAFTVEGS